MRVLQYGVRFSVLLKYFGQLCIALALLALVPLAISLWFGEYHISLRYGSVSAAVLLLGTLCTRLPAPKNMQNNEAVAITVLIFLFSPLVMTWPVMASGFSFTDALFETISAVTTTGLSTATDLGDATRTFLFSRAWMQWIGGLGIVVLCMAALIQPGMTTKRLDISEDFSDDIIGGTRAAARRIVIIYSLVTLAGIGLMMLAGIDWFTATLYILAAVSTGGFSPHDNSLAGLANMQGAVIATLFSLAGAVSLTLYYQLYRGKVREVFADRQLQAFVLTAATVVALLIWLQWYQDGLGLMEAVRNGTLNGLSAMTTAGFSSAPIAEMGSTSQLTLIIAMSIGGCAGSTAGGIKIIRLLILFRLIYFLIQRAGAPSHAVVEADFEGKQLTSSEIHNATSLFVCFGAVVTLSWMFFLVMGYPPLASLFEVVSALGTAGLSTGITSSELHPLLKAVLSIDMLLGRLEIIAWLIFFHPGTWFSLKKEG